MTKLVLGLVLWLVMVIAAPAGAQGLMDQESGRLYQRPPGGQNIMGNGFVVGPGTTYLGPIRPNAYGPGINADATGRPFQWQPEGMQPTGLILR